MTVETEEKLIATVARVEQAVCGNGVPGLRDEIKDLQDWRKTHPQICPVTVKKRNVIAVRTFEVAAVTAVLGILDLLARVLHLIK